MNEGWKCPECGRVLAPWKEYCDHGGGIAFQPLSQPVDTSPWQTGGWWGIYPPYGHPYTTCDSGTTTTTGVKDG